jgi:hypothetical protein
MVVIASVLSGFKKMCGCQFIYLMTFIAKGMRLKECDVSSSSDAVIRWQILEESEDLLVRARPVMILVRSSTF